MKNKLKADYLKARQDKDNIARSLLSVLLGEIELSETRSDKTLSDNAIMKIIKKTLKSCVECKKHGDATANLEIMILEQYIPKTISTEEIHCLIVASPLYQEIIDADRPMKLMGQVMGMLADSGVAADGRDVSSMIKEIKADQNVN